MPLIAKADCLSSEHVDKLKENIISELEANDIRSFPLGSSKDAFKFNITAPYAVSSKPSKDEETMDASLLMSPDYIQPLLPSELAYLVAQLFEPDTISWLRHSAAKKFVQWRESTEPISRPQSLYRPLSQSSIIGSSTLLGSPVGAITSYAVARITDHTQREEKIAQVRLANWAADLQRSLQNERRQYEELAKSERAVWLTERLGECVKDGTIIPLSQARASSPAGEKPTKRGYSRRRQHERIIKGLNPHDPLGLLELNEEIKRKAMFALGVVSSFGFIGGLAIWFTRQWREVDPDDLRFLGYMGNAGGW